MRLCLVQKRLRLVEMVAESEVFIQECQCRFGVCVYQIACLNSQRLSLIPGATEFLKKTSLRRIIPLSIAKPVPTAHTRQYFSQLGQILVKNRHFTHNPVLRVLAFLFLNLVRTALHAACPFTRILLSRLRANRGDITVRRDKDSR